MMADQAAMDEEPLGPAWKIGCAAVALVVAAFAASFVTTIFNVSHDKSLNSRMQILWFDPKGAPLGTVVAANNRWMENAFIADVSREDGKKIAVLVLDDHYLSGDGSLRSESGVIGDPISRAVLCSVPAQAKKKKVELDPVVVKLIKSQC